MSNIFEFKDKIEKDRSRGFVSFESMMPAKKGEDVRRADPVAELEKKKTVLQREIEEMLALAEAEKKRIEQEAYDKGFAQGIVEGREAGKEDFSGKSADALRLIALLEQERNRVNRQYEEELLVLVTTMVERLVGHEVSVNPLVIKNCLHSAMAFVVEDSVVKVHLHPEDFQRLKEMSLEDPSLLQGAKRVELLDDPAVSLGGCLLETDFGEIDARLEKCREKLFELVDRAFMAALAADG